MGEVGARRITIVDHDPDWSSRFMALGAALRERLGDAVVRIDHIGSTAVRGLAAKDVIDIQVTVARLEQAGAWPDELLPNLLRRPAVTADHVPLGVGGDVSDWAKLYWADQSSIHVHVRETGRLNQRYPLLFRDYLRADAVAAVAYGLLKRALAETAADDWDAYCAIKDPACDLVIAGAEQWAVRTSWEPGPGDA